MMPRLIGVTGHMGCGKDAAGALLRMLGYRRVALADAVRDEVRGALSDPNHITIPGCAPLWLAGDLMDATLAEVDAKPTSERMRRILQWWGTEYRRASDPLYWVNRASEVWSGPGMWVCTDVRFPNEAAAIRRDGGVVWRVSRPTKVVGIENHESERLISQIKPDLVLDNSGALQSLAEQILVALDRFGPLRRTAA